MGYNQVSFNKITLNITSPQGEGVSFNKGEMLKGIVQDVRQDGLVMLLIKGKLVEAATEVMVKSGQQLFLMVDDMRDGKTYLKVITPQMMGEIENANLSVGLLDIGVQSKEENIVMARKLLQHNLPVTQDNLNNLARGVKILGELNPRNLELVAFAQSRGLNINSATLNTLSQFTSAEGNLIKNLYSVFQSITQIASQPNLPPDLIAQLQDIIQGEAAPNSPNPAAPVQTGKESPQVLSGFLPGSQNMADVVISNTGADSSGEPGQLIGKAEIPELVSAGTGEMPGTRENVLKSFIAVMRPILDLIQVDMGEPNLQVADKIRTIIQAQPEIIKGLLLLEDVLKNQENKDLLKSPVLTELLQKVESLEKELTGQRLFNTVARMPGENAVNIYYFSFPVRIDNEYRLCQLKIDRDTDKKKYSHVDNLNFVVSLDTPRLGLVLFHINWRRSGDLHLQGVVENAGTRSYLNNNINQLIEGLKGLGYRVTNSGIKIARGQSETNLRPEMKEMPDNIVKPFSIDVKV
ncbi:MAG: flagellar hook-length control protein FliK [Syntrophomonas sp.]